MPEEKKKKYRTVLQPVGIWTCIILLAVGKFTDVNDKQVCMYSGTQFCCGCRDNNGPVSTNNVGFVFCA